MAERGEGDVMTTVTYDGYTFAEPYIATGIVRPMPTAIADTVEVSGADGVTYLGSRLDALKVGFTVVLPSSTEEQRRELVHDLASKLYRTELKRLEFSSDNGRYYLAVLDGTPDYQEFVRTGKLVVEMLCPSPAMYGEEVTATIPAGGNVTIGVGGNYPTSLRFTARDDANEQTAWKVILDSRRYIHVTNDETPIKTLSIDSERRTCTVNSQTVLPTLDSDWFVVDAGQHTLANTIGHMEAQVSYIERWL